jgi:phospholipid transport system substrate-binding protein
MKLLKISLGLVLGVFFITQQSFASNEAFNLIKQQSDRMLEFITTLDKGAKDELRESKIVKKTTELLVPHIDFKSMTYLAMGKSFKKLDEAKQQELSAAFKALLVKTYAKTMNKYTNERILYDPYQKSVKANRAVVKTNISQTSTVAIPVHYKLLLKENKWLIYDILVDGISLIKSYRTTFKNEIKTHGVDGLIKSLKNKTIKTIAK